jgi:RHS repeat-associated protein
VFDDHITRDAGGRITQRVETIDGLTRVFDYVYDVPGRLSIVRRNGTLVVMYTYDENGNRIVAEGEAGLVEGTYDGQDRALTYGNESYTYTANGELATKTVAGQTTSYSYDTLGNLIEVTKPEGTVITYTVDGRGRRVEKAIGGFPVKRWIYADQLRPIAELDGNGTVVSRFVYGTRMNVPEYVIKNGVTYRIFSDHLGSPRIVMNAATGEVVQRMDFQAFGESIQDSNPGWQPFGFAGGLYDPDTGLVRFGARDYDPRVGNWTAKDPTLFEGRSLNLYGYAVSDPVNLLDSEGESWESAAWAAAEGAAVGATGALAVGGIAVGAATIGVPAAAITTGLAAVVVVGAAVTGYNIVEAVGRGDWDAVANDVGGVIGGMAAGAASGRWVAEGVNGVKSPPWGWRSDAAQMYDRNYPGGSPGKWWATGPNPGSAAGATGSGGAGVAALLRSLQCK